MVHLTPSLKPGWKKEIYKALSKYRNKSQDRKCVLNLNIVDSL